MPAFTAIGAWVATSVFGLAAGSLAAAVVGGIVATGAALLTSRLINGSPGSGAGGGEAAQTGTRVQLSPSTENKVPVLYGEAYCSPIITDAYLDNQNKTMTYVMVIAETCNITGATYTVQDIYWNDLRLYFGNGSDPSRATQGRKYVNPPNPIDPYAASGPTVIIENEDHVDTHFDDKVFINVYAGNTTAAKRIFGKNESARDFVNKYNASNWEDDKYRYEGFITAVLRVNYDSEKGFTGLPTLTFKLKNSVDNPAAVLADYMTSDRYGANIPLANINSGSLATFESFCNEVLNYTDIDGNTTTSKRYVINGLIDTNRTCKENIDTILLNSGAWMSYDVALGQWRVIPKKTLPGTTWSGAYESGTPTNPLPQIIFNDDNITSGIQISSTRLDNLFNIAGVEFYDRYNKDQRGYLKVIYDENKRNYNEPDNALNLTLDLTNNSVQAERVANIELKQSRDDLVITFTTAHYGLQAQAGDVIGVYNTLYGWCEPTYPNGKYFRVLSTVEKEINEGALENEITALEYNAEVYANEPITEFATSANIGIIPRTGSPNIPAPIVRITGSDPTSGTPSFTIEVEVPNVPGGPYDELQIWVAEDWDWLGVGGDVEVKGQILGTTFSVQTWEGPNLIRAAAETYGPTGGTITGIGTEIAGLNVLPNTKVVNFGASIGQYYGNGKTGQYTVTPSHATNTGLRTMYGWVQAAKFTGTVAGNTLTVTSVANGTIDINSLVRGYTDVSGGAASGLAADSVILRQLTGTTGGVGTYQLSKTTTPNITTPTVFVTSEPYPADTSYRYHRSIFTKPGFTGLFDQGEIRDSVITGLPANAQDKKYFVRCRLGIDGEYGPLSELNELTVDLEAPTVIWEPDSQSALNIKRELVKMDFGKLTIPRNGLWLMRTATQLDGGRLAEYNRDYFNLDLGNFDAEDEIASEDDIQDFTYDPND